MGSSRIERELTLSASCYTPFTANGAAINEVALRRQLQRFVDAGLSSVWLVSSGTAERNVLSDGEVDRIIDVAVEEVSGRIKVYAMGAEWRSAPENVAFANRMLARGVDGVQVGPLEPGHSYLPMPSELGEYYEQVLGEVDGPCFLSSHVSVGYEAPPELLVDTARSHSQVVGINVTHFRSFAYAPRVLELAGGDVPVVLGSPINALDGLLRGASGIMSSFDMNVAPWMYRDLGAAWTRQDLRDVGAAYTRVSGLFLAILGSGGLVVAKAILDRLGLEGGPPRRPRRAADDAVRRRADEIVSEFGLERENGDSDG